jgi:hypothetical protein
LAPSFEAKISFNAMLAGTGQYFDFEASIISSLVRAMNDSGSKGRSFLIRVTKAPSISPFSKAKRSKAVITPPEAALYLTA